ncbi:hypothetical protein SAMN04488550_4122 [Gordonia malaquae]|uniref:Uncharacterized protein n=1 Tax=Gordonia malaquae NBRC 108250 TaxID=1223542 RepID=M3VGV4_GORML|nr:hypothetical protein [Gordonia malaquae]GAC81224.1 hypothetical protein GM1_030_00530 [Gordonia malaquae NBRC 108250]SEE23856.1 hypothetical protein SAMN04488550_4122 [Gordonia malaquae]
MADLPVTLTHPKTKEQWVCETPTALHTALSRGFVAPKDVPKQAPTPAPEPTASASAPKPDTKTTTK